MTPFLGRSIVAATALALAAQTALAAPAAFATPPALDPSSTTSAASGPQFRPDPNAAPVAPPAPSAQRQATRSAVAPDTVHVTITDVTSTEARATWNIPANNGSPITGYHLQLLSGDVVIEEADWDPLMTAVWLTDLTPDTTYGFRVAAVNAEGAGEYSMTATFTTSHFWLERVYGQSRYETAVRVSEQAFPYEGVSAAFIANGRNFPDALAAAAAGGTFGGPVLLTRPTSVDAVTVDEVAALKPQYVIAAGGTAAVGDSVFNTLGQYATVEPLRMAGQSRYDTAGWISQLWGGPTDTVYLASGTDFPDALAGAAAAGHNRSPVLLTRRDGLPAETAFYLGQLQPKNLVVLGGTGAVSEAVVNQAKAATGGTVTSVSRFAGASRYDTAVEISEGSFPSPRVPVVYVASGRSFADALAGAAAAGSLGGPVLLTQPASITAETLAELDRLDPVRVVVLGGPGVVSQDVYDKILAALRK